MTHLKYFVSTAALAACALLLLSTAYARADDQQQQAFDIQPQGMSSALDEFARQSQRAILFAPRVTEQRSSDGVRGTMEPLAALQILLQGSGLSFSTTASGAILVGDSANLQPMQQQERLQPTSGDLQATRSFSDQLRVAQVDQGAPASARPVESADASDASLEQIVVTAVKFNVDVMHAPVSLTAINGDTLQMNEIHQMNDLQFYVPGLSFTNSPSGPSLNIRGVGLTFSSPNIAQGVPLYRDGLLVPASIGDEPLWDLANVQVLRGPQGTLVGANSTGGAMFINTANPVLDGDVHGYAHVEGGDYHHVRVESATNLPVTDTFAARVGVYYERRDSFSENLTANNFDVGGGIPALSNRDDPGGLNMLGLRATLLWRPTDLIQVLGKVDYFQNKTAYVAEKPIPITSTAVNGVTTACPAPGSYFGADPATWAQVPVTCGYAAFAPANPYQIAYGANDTLYNEQIWRESLETRIQLYQGGPTVRLLGGLSYNTTADQAENTGSPFYTGGANSRTNEHTTTVEADLIAPANTPLQWVVGGFWWDDPSKSIYAPANFSGGPYGVGPGYSEATGGLFLDGENERKSYAVFGNVSYAIGDKWKIEGGVRETWDRNVNNYEPCPATLISSTCYLGDANAFHFLNPNPADPWGPLVFNGSGFQNLGAESDSLFTWKAAVDYSITDRNFLYADVATGAKAGGIRTNVPGDNFAPEKVTDYELGWKSSLLDGHASVQLDGFYSRYTNMQIRARDITSGQGSIFNAGKADIHGLEFAGQANYAGWQIAGTASYTKSSVSVNGIVNQDVCNLYVLCAPNNTAQCPPGAANGTSINGHPCFNYQAGGAEIDGQFFPFLENLSGVQLPNSPQFQGDLTLAYTVPLGESTLTPRLDYYYQGKQYVAIYGTPLDLFPSRTNLNAKLLYERHNWQLEAFVLNVSNRVYPISQDTSFANNVEIFNSPRQWGLRATRSW